MGVGEREELYREIRESRSDASGYYALLGMRVEELGEGRARFSMSAGPRLWNTGGVVHGGALASLADASIGTALATLIDHARESIATIEMKINFAAPVREGDVVAEGVIIQKGRTVAIGESTLTDTQGKLLAKAIATFSIRSHGG